MQFKSCLSLCVLICFYKISEVQAQEALNRESSPLVFAIAENLHNWQSAQDIDLGPLDVSHHPRTEVIRTFLEGYRDGRVLQELVDHFSYEPLNAYLQDLRKDGLRFTSFRIGLTQVKPKELYEVRVKLMGYGQKHLISVVLSGQSVGSWKILAVSADTPS